MVFRSFPYFQVTNRLFVMGSKTCKIASKSADGMVFQLYPVLKTALVRVSETLMAEFPAGSATDEPC